jgi:hypothetical protein
LKTGRVYFVFLIKIGASGKIVVPVQSNYKWTLNINGHYISGKEINKEAPFGEEVVFRLLIKNKEYDEIQFFIPHQDGFSRYIHEHSTDLIISGISNLHKGIYFF